MRIAARLAGVLLAGAVPAAVAQTGGGPLRKTDLIRLLANPLIQRSEIADVVRRNCLSFRPSQRDWSDLRSLGADAEVLGSVGSCATRGAVPASPASLSPPPPLGDPPATVSLVAAFLVPRIATVAGARATVPIMLKRADGMPARIVTLALRATPRVAAGPPGEVTAVTDDSGFAAFDVPVGRLPGRYRLELIGGSGTPLPGRPAVELIVSPGPPATAEVHLSALDPGAGDTTVVVALRDSLRNAVPHEPVELRPERASIGVPADTQTTDSLGRVSFRVRRALVREPGQLQVRARGATLATVPAAPLGPLFEAGFVHGVVRSGLPRTWLADALTFQVRTPSGAPLPGKVVRFQGSNAELDRDNAVTDAAGQVALQVRLGMKAGPAFITAIIDSLRWRDTLEVGPGDAVDLVLEREDTRVDGGHILVELGTPFSLTLRARDRYGNLAPTTGLRASLEGIRRAFNSRGDRLLTLAAVQPQSTAIVLTFKPIRVGSTDLTIDVGLRTGVTVEVIKKRD